MNIGGFQRFSMIDYPGKISAVIFVRGCNFRCPYCHNSQLVRGGSEDDIGFETVMDFLKTRKGKLQGVVITGGEPTLVPDLEKIALQIRDMGYSVKLDTNGSRPDILSKLISSGALDYIAMDIKAPLQRYREVTLSKVDIADIKRSIQLIQRSSVAYEFRTTTVGSLITTKDVRKIAQLLTGSERYVIQNFVPRNTLDPEYLNKKGWSKKKLKTIQMELKEYFGECIVRENI